MEKSQNSVERIKDSLLVFDEVYFEEMLCTAV